jgi:Domain of unknown function (DUF4062)
MGLRWSKGVVVTEWSAESRPGRGSQIKTPDQRIRVFVSSTLSELAEERRAARDAIVRMRMTPVMFETGARPHSARALYRAYLAQSDIFVGIYWQSYGWVAPSETVSGLEDEYQLSGDRPRLIYVKASNNRRSWRTFLPEYGRTIGPPISTSMTQLNWASFWPTTWQCCSRNASPPWNHPTPPAYRPRYTGSAD